MEYLQSPEALRNARRARERRIENRAKRANREPRTKKTEPRTKKHEPNPEAEDEPRSEKPEA